VFVDIDPVSYNIDPTAVRAAVTDKTKAILPVHLFGLPADMNSVVKIGEECDLAIVEDAGQALGANVNGRAAGSMGDVGCFSFYPTKNLGGFGDAGMLTTNSDDLADRLRLLRGHGMRPRYYHEQVGINSRLDTIQAVVLNVKLPHLSTWSEARQRNAARYEELFHNAALTEDITLPTYDSTYGHVWNQYTIRVPGFRDELRAYLTKHNVGTEIYYPVPLHQQKCFASVEQRFELPETERAAKEVVSLPIFPTMTVAEQKTVVMRIADFVAAQRPSISYREVA
jgi:dTDP-4-amino-4,6-dideoxygalactose transaminase